MEYVKLGNTGLDVSRICLGTMGFGVAERYSPLASGRLTRGWSDTTHRSQTDPIQKSNYDATADADRLIIERVAETAEKHVETAGPNSLIFVYSDKRFTIWSIAGSNR